jgi:hypothetical protein
VEGLERGLGLVGGAGQGWDGGRKAGGRGGVRPPTPCGHSRLHTWPTPRRRRRTCAAAAAMVATSRVACRALSVARCISSVACCISSVARRISSVARFISSVAYVACHTLALWVHGSLPYAARRCRYGWGEPSPGADVAAVSAVPAQMWLRSRCRCGRGEPHCALDEHSRAFDALDHALKVRSLAGPVDLSELSARALACVCGVCLLVNACMRACACHTCARGRACVRVRASEREHMRVPVQGRGEGWGGVGWGTFISSPMETEVEERLRLCA